jgi:SlyX protein
MGVPELQFASRNRSSRAVADDLAQRIEALEVKVAFQDDLLATLNRDVAEMDRVVRALRQELGAARAALEGMRSALGHDMRDEPPPPHY